MIFKMLNTFASIQIPPKRIKKDTETQVNNSISTLHECKCYVITDAVFGSPVPCHKQLFRSCVQLNKVFTLLNAVALINFSRFERGAYSRAAFIEGGVYLKSNLFLTN